MRNYIEQWIGGTQKAIYAKDVLMAELLAILEGLRYAQKEFLNNIIIVSDNKQAISLMNRDSVARDFYCHVLNERREWQKMVQAFQFLFEKEQNRVGRRIGGRL